MKKIIPILSVLLLCACGYDEYKMPKEAHINLNDSSIEIYDINSKVNDLIKSIIFIPYEFNDTYGITTKKELVIFIGGLFDSITKPIQYLSRSCSFLILGIHEGCGHWISSLYNIFYQDISLFDSVNLQGNKYELF